MKKKLLLIAVSLFLSLSLLAACAGNDYGKVELAYYDTFSTAGKDYNGNLFYRNDLTVKGADPSVIYVEKGTEAGWFYMYATSDDIGASGYQAWRSKDLQNWECVGVVFRPDGDSWCLSDLWAPEVIYDDADELFYLFFNATNNVGIEGKKTQSMGMAYSASPKGPFTLWTGTVPAGTYADETEYEEYEVTNKTPLFDFRRMPDEHPLKDGIIKVIDASPFIDTDGSRYLYFCRDLGGGGTSEYVTSEIWGMKMIDWHTPDYSTVARLTRNGYTKVSGGDSINEGVVNEAAFMIKEDGKYYLTFSVYSYWDKLYQVRQAIAESPLGDFEKVKVANGGVVIAAETENDSVSGTGHHSFVTAGVDKFIVYHAHINRTTGGGQRAIAFDRYSFVNNGTVKVIHSNGPTYSLQPLPTVYSGYKNIAGQATVTATNGTAGTKTEYLTDGLLWTNGQTEVVKEFTAGTGKSVITLTFSDYVSVRAIMIYNSYSFDTAFVKIDNVSFDFTSANRKAKGTAFIDNLKFDWDNLCISEIMTIGGAAIAEFDELLVNKITITITCPEGADNVAVSEIAVLGK